MAADDANKSQTPVTEVTLTDGDSYTPQTPVIAVTLTDGNSIRPQTAVREVTAADDETNNSQTAAMTHMQHFQNTAHPVSEEAATVPLVSQPEVNNGTDSELQLAATPAETGTLPFTEEEVMEYMHAAESGDAAKLQFFLDSGLPVDVLCPKTDSCFILCSGRGDTALVKACRGGQMEAARLLIARGADINAKTGALTFFVEVH